LSGRLPGGNVLGKKPPGTWNRHPSRRPRKKQIILEPSRGYSRYPPPLTDKPPEEGVATRTSNRRGQKGRGVTTAPARKTIRQASQEPTRLRCPTSARPFGGAHRWTRPTRQLLSANPLTHPTTPLVLHGPTRQRTAGPFFRVKGRPRGEETSNLFFF